MDIKNLINQLHRVKFEQDVLTALIHQNAGSYEKLTEVIMELVQASPDVSVVLRAKNAAGQTYCASVNQNSLVTDGWDRTSVTGVMKDTDFYQIEFRSRGCVVLRYSANTKDFDTLFGID